MDKSIFTFAADGTFSLTYASGTQVHGTFQDLAYSSTLSDHQFVLDGAGMNIRFDINGKAFVIYIDGMSSPDTWKHASNS